MIAPPLLTTVLSLYLVVSVPTDSSGADDLIPILSFVIVKSRMPQLVSECRALEEFIHEGYVVVCIRQTIPQWSLVNLHQNRTMKLHLCDKNVTHNFNLNS